MGRPNPCPFCRGTETHLVRYEQNGSLCCSGCGAQGPITAIGDANQADATRLATAAWDTGTPRMTHSPDGASAGGLDLDELEKVARAAPGQGWTQALWGGGPPRWTVERDDSDGDVIARAYAREAAAHIATFDPTTVLKMIAALRALSPSPGLGGEGIPGSPSAHASPLRSAAATEPGGLSEGAFTDNNIRRMAAMICEFMGWCEDGPAWDDAMKLARQVHEPAYQEGWNDRDGDLIAGVNRVLPLSSEAPSPKSEEAAR